MSLHYDSVVAVPDCCDEFAVTLVISGQRLVHFQASQVCGNYPYHYLEYANQKHVLRICMRPWVQVNVKAKWTVCVVTKEGTRTPGGSLQEKHLQFSIGIGGYRREF